MTTPLFESCPGCSSPRAERVGHHLYCTSCGTAYVQVLPDIPQMLRDQMPDLIQPEPITERTAAMTIRRTAEISLPGRATAADLASFATSVPAAAEITVRSVFGDPRDPRESGHRETTITATWTEEETQ